jgi:predicted nucleotidyltransferase
LIKEKKIPYDVLKSLNELLAELRKDEQISAFYIFGRAASGSLNPLSDLDFAVLLNNSENQIDSFKIELNIRAAISRILKTEEFDLIILNSAPVNFVKNIINTGKLLFSKNKTLLIDFIERAGMQYLDFKFYRNQFLDTFKEKAGIK